MVVQRVLLGAGLCLLLVGCGDTAAPEPLRPLTSISAGGAHTCALTDQGTAYCWGSSEHGQVGTGEAGAYARPVSVVTSLHFREIDAGFVHTCAIAEDRSAHCWGSNASGQLGTEGGFGGGLSGGMQGVLGGVLTSHVPVAVAGGHRFTQVSAGRDHSCGVTEEGRVLCWGSNGDGQLGDGSREPRLEPVPIASEERFAAVAAGGFHTCALAVDGRVHCWGRNASGQLGDRTLDDRWEPAPVTGQTRFVSISAGHLHNCAPTAGDEIFCWGGNETGELGHNWFSPGLDFPAAVARPEAYAHVTTGEGFTCALDRAGQAFCWGAAALGQLGMARTDDRAYPITVLGPTFTTITAGSTHTCALDRQGRGYCWGTGESGQLGTQTTNYSPTPIPVDWTRLR